MKTWKDKGDYIKVWNHNVFYIFKNTGKPLIAFLHGYPTSSIDFAKILPFIENDYDYIIHDHLGFGLSDKPLNYSYSLIEQAEVALALWQKLGIKELHLVSHDYGTTVANEIVFKKINGYEPIKINTVTFSNGSMHIELAHLKFIQKMLKHPYWGKIPSALMNETIFLNQMKSIWYDKNLFDKEEMKLSWQLIQHNQGKKIFHAISQYNNDRVKFWNRWIGCLPKLNIPTLILWAQNDPIAVDKIAEQLYDEIPNSIYHKIENCGHYPMLEQPKLWANGLLDFLKLQTVK
jgi:pimeloyl-ACP methyl ester carboxylesterase